jgi:hypothetical protein
MREREEDTVAVATAVGRHAGGRGSACSGRGRSEVQREGMATLLCSLSLGRKTYIHEVQGHYGPVAWAGPPLSIQRFSFFLLFFPSPCCYAAIFLNGMASPQPHLIMPRRRLSGWKGVKLHASSPL